LNGFVLRSDNDIADDLNGLSIPLNGFMRQEIDLELHLLYTAFLSIPLNGFIVR
jgi:hypothetical protein